MIASPVHRSFALPCGRQVTFLFFLKHRFGHFLRDHALNEREPWQRVLHVRVKRQENLRQQLESSDVLERDRAEAELYQPSVDVLTQGIEYSTGFPVFVEFIQERRSGLDRPPNETQGFYFLGEPGFLVVVREDVVRTARFEVGIKGNLSRAGLFREAWKHVLARVSRAPEYLDSKDQEYVRHVSVRRVSEENWAQCPV